MPSSSRSQTLTQGLTLEDCIKKLGSHLSHFDSKDIFCNVTSDNALCWPPTKAGTTASQRCPSVDGSDTNKFAYRTCGQDGKWSPKWANAGGPWTNYTQCYRSEAELIFQFDSENIRKASSEDITHSSILGICGLSFSLLAVFLTLAYMRYKDYKGARISVYKNLLATLVIEASVKLSFQIILLMVWIGEGLVITMFDIPHLCEIFVVIVEFAELSTYIWITLHGHLCYLEAKQYDPYKVQVLYSALGWGVPIITLAEWLAVQAATNDATCWYGYRFQQSAWILELPRVWGLLLGIGFLLYTTWIMHDTGHMRDITEMETIRRSTIACFTYIVMMSMSLTTAILLAHLAQKSDNVPNLLGLIYTITFLTSFRGLFISLGYWVWEHKGEHWHQKVSLV